MDENTRPGRKPVADWADDTKPCGDNVERIDLSDSQWRINKITEKQARIRFDEAGKEFPEAWVELMGRIVSSKLDGIQRAIVWTGDDSWFELRWD